MNKERTMNITEDVKRLSDIQRMKRVDEAIDMAIEALSADATVAKIKIDDIDKAKTSSQLLDDLAVDMVKAMGKRIVEVVRCKDCKWYKKIVEKSKSGLCHYDLVARCLHDEDYCSHGERREE